MSTTIRTNSEKKFKNFMKYFSNKRLHFTTSTEDNIYVIRLFDLNNESTEKLIKLFTRYFNLTKKTSFCAALAA